MRVHIHKEESLFHFGSALQNVRSHVAIEFFVFSTLSLCLLCLLNLQNSYSLLMFCYFFLLNLLWLLGFHLYRMIFIFRVIFFELLVRKRMKIAICAVHEPVEQIFLDQSDFGKVSGILAFEVVFGAFVPV